MFPLIRDFAAGGGVVVVTCDVLGFSYQAFDKWQAKPVCDRDDSKFVNALIDAHTIDLAVSYWFLAQIM